MDYALELREIRKRYKTHDVLHNLDMQVPFGKVYGFLGRNGAGKTTTIRTITGLIQPDAGSILVFGQNVRKYRSAAMRSIGAIVEGPAFYPNLSAAGNLRISADLFDAAYSRIDTVLQITDMAKESNRKVKTFSTGMKQRLAIANALIHSPRILILDEPTNGLDPNGVRDLRALIKRLSGELDITILISSHILSEIGQIADYVGILNDGRLADQFDIRELNRQEQTGLLLDVEQPEQAAALLQEKGIRFSAVGQQLKVLCPREQNAEINTMLASGGITVIRMNPVKDSLEDRFFSAVGSRDPQEV